MPLKKTNNFPPAYEDPVYFLKMLVAWQLLDIDSFSIDYMEESERLDAILDDILSVSMWEIEFNKKLNFTRNELVRFISPEKQFQILDLLNHPRITQYVDLAEDQLRINPDKYQEVMDEIGVWYEGYVIPDNQIVATSGSIAHAFVATPVAQVEFERAIQEHSTQLNKSWDKTKH